MPDAYFLQKSHLGTSWPSSSRLKKNFCFMGTSSTRTGFYLIGGRTFRQLQFTPQRMSLLVLNQDQRERVDDSNYRFHSSEFFCLFNIQDVREAGHVKDFLYNFVHMAYFHSAFCAHRLMRR